MQPAVTSSPTILVPPGLEMSSSAASWLAVRGPRSRARNTKPNDGFTSSNPAAPSAWCSYRLGINTCFAVKRWPEPELWAEIVRARLGLELVQHSLDLVEPQPLVERQAVGVRTA